MNNKLLRRFITFVTIVSTAIFSSTVCFAAEDNIYTEVSNAVETMVEADNGTALPQGDAITRANLGGAIATVTTGSLSSSFTVPANLSGSLVKVAIVIRTYDSSANPNATFALTIKSGDTPIRTVYPIVNENTFVIGNLADGTYNFSLSPQSNVSGNYVVGIQFYTAWGNWLCSFINISL